MDGSNTLHLGSDTAPWQIKDFSVTLRRAITEAARQQDVTVSEFLHAHFTKFGVDGVVVEGQTGQALPVKPDTSIDDLCRLTEAAAKLAETRDRMPKALAGALSRRLREALRTGAPPRPKAPPMLTTDAK